MSESAVATLPVEEASAPIEASAPQESSAPSFNPFEIAGNQAQEESSQESEAQDESKINLSDCNFDDPKDFEAAKSQNGRMKKFIEELKAENKSLDRETPESYELNIGDDLKDSNVQISSDDPMLNSFKDVAKELNLSQDQFNKVANFYITQEANAQNQLMEDTQAHVNNVISQLGETPEAGMERLRSITSRLADAGLSESTITSMQECLSIDVKAIEGMESLFKSQRYAHPVEGNNVQPSLKSRHEQIQSDMAKAEYHSDPSFKSRTVEKLGKLHQEAVKQGISLS